MKLYAGIGSRQAPTPMLEVAERLAMRLRGEGWTLRSGHAEGMDQAFEGGAGEDAEVYLPWSTFGSKDPIDARRVFDRPTSQAYNIAGQHHPAWSDLSNGVRLLHARNVHQVLGIDCATPVKFVACWTPGGSGGGGTGQALRIARAHDVPIFDLGRDDARHRIEGFASELD